MKPVWRTYENPLCILNRFRPLRKRGAISLFNFFSDFFYSCMIGERIRLFRFQFSQFSVCDQRNILCQPSCDSGIGIIDNQRFQFKHLIFRNSPQLSSPFVRRFITKSLRAALYPGDLSGTKSDQYASSYPKVGYIFCCHHGI